MKKGSLLENLICCVCMSAMFGRSNHKFISCIVESLTEGYLLGCLLI